MANPFFRGGLYPWHLPEATALHQTLWKSVTQFQRIDILYRASGATRPLNANASPDIIWKEVLDELCANGFLEEFCRALSEDQQLGEPIRQAVAAIRDAQDPVKQTMLSGDRIFLDRRELRDKLERLADSTAVRVLLVRGGGDVGKSYTNWLVFDVAKSLGHDCVYLFADLAYSIDEVLEMLFAKYEAEPPPRMETEDSWFRKICARLLVLAEKKQKKCWVIMDDLGTDAQGPRLDPFVRRFFDQFALAMGNHGFAQWFHLVLLDYPEMPEAGPRGVPTKWGDFWEEDRPDPARVDAEDVTSFILEWAKRKKKNVSPADAKQLAADVLAAADAATPVPRLQTIHDTLKAKLARL